MPCFSWYRATFDPKDFCDSVYYVGRPYRYRAIELISICQTFSVASGQSFSQDTELLSAIEECDKAISCAINFGSGKKESQEINDQFDEAIRRLRDYESKHHPRTVDERMKIAKKNDEEKKKKSRDRSKDGTLEVVEFHILQSLPYNNPVIVRQALRSGANIKDLPEILWNFSHFKDKEYLSLVQNPHFYGNLPESPRAYGPTFKGKCIENSLPNKIFVPTNNNSRRVYFNFPSNQPSPRDRNRRVFDVWKTKSALIFKDVLGNLEGETNIENIIKPCAPPFTYCKRHTPGHPQAEEVGTTDDDWRVLVGTTDDTTRTHICVSDRGTEPTGRVH